jgi:hypothetical protein
MNTLIKILDFIVDSINLYRSGFCLCKGKWHLGEREFSNTAAAVDAMRTVVSEQACRNALQHLKTNFSGKSRNAPCICGSGKKFKNCCMIPD